MTEVGSFALVLHTHLPWVAHNGTWPVGEEWLHQAFTGSWRRVIGVLERLAGDGVTDALTLGVTPVVAAMLDDPYCLREIHSWTGRWQLRAEEFGARSNLGAWERAAAVGCLADLESRWLTGGLSSVLRPLVDAGVVEVLSGPATHPFQPLLTERFATAQLRTGLADTQLRLGVRPSGIWAPECGYAPGMAEFYAQNGIARFLVDGPAVAGASAFGHPVDGTDVVAFARDEELSNQVWSARTGYPGGVDYRDFHTFDHGSGFRPARVTGSEEKQPWVPERAFAAARADAEHFVAAVVARLTEQRDRFGRESLVVAAFDTELFGHWWYEGPEFLENVLRLLGLAGVRLTTLATAQERGLLAEPVELPASSWGAGKDWRVWENARVAELNDDLGHLQKRLFGVLDERDGARGRDAAADQLVREALLASASDWAFMITRDSAADYAWQRARGHVRRFHDLADALPDPARAAELAAELRAIDGPFGHLDSRGL